MTHTEIVTTNLEAASEVLMAQPRSWRDEPTVELTLADLQELLRMQEDRS